jgi:hypothetical protein
MTTIAMLTFLMAAPWAANGAEESKSALAFQRLTSLVGEWEGVQSGTEVHATYTLTADGSALMEEFRPQGGATMVTMFTVDGERLIATHYCSAKNQPQMATPDIIDPRASSLVFSLVKVTGLEAPDAWHNTGLVLTLEDQSHLKQEWTYLYKGKTGNASFRLTRATPTAAAAADPGRQMIAVLPAAGPHPSLGDQARIWDRFVGTWDCDFGFFAEDGTVRHTPGELEFGWVLDGRAIQDLWITYPKAGETERGIGTSIRFLDADSATWRVVFVSPKFSAVLMVQGGLEGDRIVLRGRDPEGALLRWSFNDIQADSFTWRGERSRDDGKTWRLEEEHHMKRRLAPRVDLALQQGL